MKVKITSRNGSWTDELTSNDPIYKLLREPIVKSVSIKIADYTLTFERDNDG